LSTVGRLGSILSLLNGLWSTYIAIAAMNAPASCPEGGCPTTAYTYLLTLLLVVAVALVVDSLTSFRGFRVSFILGAVLSALVVGLVALQWSSFGATVSAVSVLLSVLSVVSDILATRPSKPISEQSHPLNLPVFG
jgi:hypothetical protein